MEVREEQAVTLLPFKGLELGDESSLLGLSDYPDCRIDGGNDEKGTLDLPGRGGVSCINELDIIDIINPIAIINE
ncbi:MAG: hypothetical protein RRE78_08785 [Acidianus sp.]|jgi:hypothetical protein|nr:hypothetical protein [Acidianus sp.]